LTFKRLFYLFSAIVVTAGSIFAAQMIDVYAYSRSGELRHADAAIVLGAAAWGNNPSPVFRERINHAIKLYKDGFCRYVIITGGKGFPSEPGESVIGKKYAMKNGIPEDAILIENYSRSTEENLAYAKRVAGGHGIRSFLLVSDPFHLRRASLVADHYGLLVFPSPTTTSMYKSNGERLSFLVREAYYTILFRVRNFLGLVPVE
jgi:uncharacterized SAM-binding protein YcdF (DUF218 family)